MICKVEICAWNWVWNERLGSTKRILSTDIIRNRDNGTLVLFQSGYVKKVLESYDMLNAKLVNTLMGVAFKLKFVVDELSCVEHEFMKKIFYLNRIGSLMYDTIGNGPNMIYAISLVSRFMDKPFKEH